MNGDFIKTGPKKWPKQAALYILDKEISDSTENLGFGCLSSEESKQNLGLG